MDTVNVALTTTQAIARALKQMEASGWEMTRTFSIVSLVCRTSSPGDVLASLNLAELGGVHAIAWCEFGPATLQVTAEADGTTSVTDTGSVDVRSTFAREDWDNATDAWSGDADAALVLPGQWTIEIEVDLSASLQAAAPDFTWQVLRSVEDVARLVQSVPSWELAPTIDRDRPSLFVVEDLPAEEFLHLGRAAILPLSSTAGYGPAVKQIESATFEPWHPAELPHAPRPGAVRPVLRRGSGLAAVERTLWNATAALSWIGLATTVRLEADGVHLEILGLQRVAHHIPMTGLDVSEQAARGSYELYTWAGGPEAIDQRLAIQQVASLYREDAPWSKVRDVSDAAHSVFASLRRDAVSEAMQARRAARALAIEAANRTAEQINAVTRSVVERVAATLLAIGGVIVAQTTSTITVGQAGDLRLLVAIFLIGLAAWNVLAEGPGLTGPLNDFKADLPQFTDTLMKNERADIVKLHSVVSASNRARNMRIVVPVVYVAAALAAVAIPA
jgi:hypothetical protein